MNRKQYIESDHQVIEPPLVYCSGAKLIAVCAQCHQHINISLESYWERRKRDLDSPWICHICLKPSLVEASRNNPLYKSKPYKKFFKNLHNDKDYCDRVHNDNVYSRISKSSKLAWQDPVKRSSHMAHRKTDSYKKKISKWSKLAWRDELYREKQSLARNTASYHDRASRQAKKLWENDDYRNKIIKNLDAVRPLSYSQTKTRSTQQLLYSILDDLNIKYYKKGKETVPESIDIKGSKWEGHAFDCRIKATDKWPDVYVECGSKITLLSKYGPEAQLMTLWEIEFKSPTRIRQIIIEKLGILSTKQIDFNFENVIVKSSDVNDELKRLFGKYHYLASIGRYGSNRYTAFFGDKIIAAVIFSSPTSQHSAARLSIISNELLELTRFCIHPSYQKKNFASWFLSKAAKQLWKDKPKVKKLITFADTTYGHDGVIYKATGWQYDGDSQQDYWYVDSKGNKYHKKSIWDIACKMGQKELEYAALKNLTMIMGQKKLRFLLDRPPSKV